MKERPKQWNISIEAQFFHPNDLKQWPFYEPGVGLALASLKLRRQVLSWDSVSLVLEGQKGCLGDGAVGWAKKSERDVINSCYCLLIEGRANGVIISSFVKRIIALCGPRCQI